MNVLQKKVVTWTTMNITIPITKDHTLRCISVNDLQMDFVSSQSLEYTTRKI